MSPIAHRAPAEVVHQIFAPFSTTIRTNDLKSFPWFLGHVCSGWRSIFLSMTTEFWHTIFISCEGFGEEGFGCEFDVGRVRSVGSVVQFFLERDPVALFSFDFKITENLAYQAKSNMLLILDMLIDKSKRWKDVLFQMDLSSLSRLNRAKNRLPLLQKLCLLYYYEDEITGLLVDVFQTAPSLITIDIPKLADWQFIWSNLKDVALRSPTPDFYVALPHLTNMERLHIGYSSLDDIPFSGIVCFPNLTTLDCYYPLLQIMKAPALEDLSIHCPRKNYTVDMVCSFLRRSSCNIRYLHVIGGEADMVIKIIRDTSQVTQLKLCLASIDLWFILEQLVVSSNSDELLVCHLSSLHIMDSIFLPSNSQKITLSHLLQSRTSGAIEHGCKRLERLSLNGGLVDKDEMISLCEEHEVELEFVGSLYYWFL